LTPQFAVLYLDAVGATCRNWFYGYSSYFIALLSGHLNMVQENTQNALLPELWPGL